MAAFLLALAPVACVTFCNVKHAVEQALHQQDLHFLHRHHHTDASRETDHAPFSDLQQLIRSVTELAPSTSELPDVRTPLAFLFIHRRLVAHPTELSPPTPPPR